MQTSCYLTPKYFNIYLLRIRTFYTVSKLDGPFCTHVWGFQLPSLPNLAFLNLFNFRYFRGCVEVSHLVLICIFLVKNDFGYLRGFLDILFNKKSLSGFCPFKIDCVFLTDLQELFIF